MNTVKLLDCTLRDGGFTNDWNFGFGTIKSIISRLDKAGIDVIEIGFIDERRPYDANRSILPDTKSFAPIFKNLKISHAKIAAMIDFGTCSLENIQSKQETNIDIIRVIFKKKDIDGALEFCNEIQKKGYLVSVQPVSVTSYSNEEFQALANKINKINPFSVSIVDTYGLMHNTELHEYFVVLNQHLLPNICIGFHSHNNFQMAYANSIGLLQMKTSRTLILDGSLYGMGKGAGNANTELLAQYLNENRAANYGICQLLEAIDVDILKEYAKNSWGYSLKSFIAASHDCHPDYVKTLIDKKTLSIKSIDDILNQLPMERKLTYDAKLIEQLHNDYLYKMIDDSLSYTVLSKEIQGRKILILAPGNSLETHQKEIQEFISENNPLIFSINFFNENIPVNYVFMGNPKRYSQFFHKIYGDNSTVKVISTSNITESGKNIDFIFNFDDVKSANDLVRDNPMLMLLKILSKMNVQHIALAGFDGYSSQESKNYYGDYIQFLYCNDNVVLRNEAIIVELKDLKKHINLEFITPSMYYKN